MIKKYLSFLLAILMLLPCAASAEALQPMGRYVEREIQLPDEPDYISKLFLSEDGRLMMLGSTEEGAKTYVEDDQGWTETARSQYESGFYDVAQRGEDIYVLYYHLDSDGKFESVKAGHMADGALVPLDLALNGISPYNVDIAADGTLLIQSGDCIVAFDPETGEMLDRFDGLDGAYTTQGDGLFAVSMAKQSVVQVDVATGQVINEMKDAPITQWGDVLSYDGQSLYLANQGGIYRIAPGGSIWEQLVDGSLTSLCTPSVSISGMAVRDGEIYVSTHDDQGPVLLRFSFDANVSTLPSFELNVYTLNESSTLTMAASHFQKQNPDYKVNVTTLLAEGTGVTADDAIRALNTELLSGKGPDVLLLDGMPMSDYIEKGVLHDLSPMVAELNDAGELVSSLFAPFYQDGKIYAVPTSCMLHVMLGNSDVLNEADTLDGMIALLNQSTLETPIIWRARQGYFNMFLPASFPAWFDADGQLDEEVFRRYLEAVDAIYARAGAEVDEEDEGMSIDKRDYLRAMNIIRDSEVMNGQRGFGQDLLRVKDGRSMLYPMYISSFNRDMIEMTLLSEISGTLTWLPGQASRAYAPIGMLGVNARSAQIEAATGLVRSALSQDVQDVDVYRGLPVNLQSLNKHVEKESDSTIGDSWDDPVTGEMYTMRGVWPVRAVRERIAAMLSEAATPYIPNDTLLAMIRAELAPYFDGQMDAQAATQAVSAKVRAYLAE